MRLATLTRSARNTADAESVVDPIRVEDERKDTHGTSRSRPPPTHLEGDPRDAARRRGPFLVDAETDEILVVRRGHVFDIDRASIGYLPDNTPMTYYVDPNDNVMFLERPREPRTWSEVVAPRAARK